jgi:cobalt/nickel transport system permease protein
MLPLDLRLRVAVVVAVVAILSPVTDLAPGLAYLGLVLIVALAQGPGLPWQRLLHLEAFLLLLLITLPLTLPGTPAFHVGPLTASEEGLLRAAVVACKVTASVLLMTVALADVEPLRLGHALRGLRLPEPLVRILLGVLRYLGVIRAEFRRLQDAMRLRSFRPRSNWHTWRSYGNMIGTLLLRTTTRADRVEEAMRMRSYAGRFLVPDQGPVQSRDWPVAAAPVILALGLLLWDVT